MKTVTLVDTRQAIAGESIGTVVSTHDTILAAFKANEDFQSRMRASSVKSHVPTKIVTLKVRLRIGEPVLCIGGTTFHRLIRRTPMLDCYLVNRKNPSSPLLKSFISICLELGRDLG
jgi:hypothetical protein